MYLYTHYGHSEIEIFSKGFDTRTQDAYLAYENFLCYSTMAEAERVVEFLVFVHGGCDVLFGGVFEQVFLERGEVIWTHANLRRKQTSEAII